MSEVLDNSLVTASSSPTRGASYSAAKAVDGVVVHGGIDGRNLLRDLRAS